MIAIFLSLSIATSVADTAVTANCAAALTSRLSPTHFDIIRNHKITSFARTRLAPQVWINIARVGPRSGEQIQSKFVEEILQAIVPHAKLTQNYYQTPFAQTSDRLISAMTLRLYDSAEHSQIPRAEVEMTKLKPAHTLRLARSREDLRSLLGVPESMRVLHLYGTGYQNNQSPDDQFSFQNIVRHLAKTGHRFDLVLISKTGSLDDDSEFASETWKGHCEVIDLIRPKRLRLETGCSAEPIVVRNLTYGYMPELHSVSDLVIVRGPINFFEPLNVGTPTLLINNDAILGTYDRKAFRELKELAKSAPHFAVAKDLDQMSKLARKLRGKTTLEYDSSLAVDADGKSAFEKLLDHLLEVLILLDEKPNYRP